MGSRSLLGTLLRVYGVFALLQALYKVTALWRERARVLRGIRDIPGPQWSMLEYLAKLIRNIKQIHDFRKDTIMQYVQENGAELVKLPGRPAPEVFCISEDSVRWLLKDDFNAITKAGPEEDPLLLLLSYFIGEKGIFLLRHGDAHPEEHADWIFQRKAASQIFTKNQFSRFMAEVFSRKGDVLLDALENEDCVDLQGKFFAFTADSIQEIFFNRCVDTVSRDEVDPFAQAFDMAQTQMLQFLIRYSPLHLASDLLVPWPLHHVTRYMLRTLAPEGKAFFENAEFLSQETARLVQETRRDPDIAKRKDLLARMIQAPGGDKLTDQQLREIILHFITAGRDTTACTLTWLFYELTQNLDVQERLQQEIDQVLGGRNPTMDDLNPVKMPFLNGCLYETLRLHPPVPEDIKRNSVEVSFKGQRIPAGTNLHFHPYTMGRDPARYPDPLKFDPERWIPFTPPSDYAFPVFQAGSRVCLGREMAKLEAKLLTSKLLQRFSFTLKEGEAEKISYTLMITLSLSNGPNDTDNKLWIVPKRRG